MLVLPGVPVEEEKECLEGVVRVGVREGVVDEEEEEEEEEDEAAEPRRLGVPWKREGVGMVGREVGCAAQRGEITFWALGFAEVEMMMMRGCLRPATRQ